MYTISLLHHTVAKLLRSCLFQSSVFLLEVMPYHQHMLRTMRRPWENRYWGIFCQHYKCIKVTCSWLWQTAIDHLIGVKNIHKVKIFVFCFPAEILTCLSKSVITTVTHCLGHSCVAQDYWSFNVLGLLYSCFTYLFWSNWGWRSVTSTLVFYRSVVSCNLCNFSTKVLEFLELRCWHWAMECVPYTGVGNIQESHSEVEQPQCGPSHLPDSGVCWCVQCSILHG